MNIVYRYGLRNRPAMYGTVPEGWRDEQPHVSYPYGTIAYDRKLTHEEMYRYELCPANEAAFDFRVGDRVLVNDCDPATVTGFQPNGFYNVRYDSTGEEDAVNSRYVVVLEKASPNFTPAQVAALHGVSPETVRRILRNPARRAATFPGAVRTGAGARAVWLVPEPEARAWVPRKVGRPKRTNTVE